MQPANPYRWYIVPQLLCIAIDCCITCLQLQCSILRLSRSCISVPPCIVAFALLFAVSFTLVFVKVPVWKSGTLPIPMEVVLFHTGQIQMEYCVFVVFFQCLVDLHVRFHHDVILQEFELSSLLSSYNIYVFGLVMPNELLFLRHNGTTYYVILVCSNKQNSTGFYDHFIH